MLSTIRSRLITIAALVALSVFALWPRQITVRVRGADGRMRDTVQTRVPLKRGLDLPEFALDMSTDPPAAS